MSPLPPRQLALFPREPSSERVGGAAAAQSPGRTGEVAERVRVPEVPSKGVQAPSKAAPVPLKPAETLPKGAETAARVTPASAKAAEAPSRLMHVPVAMAQGPVGWEEAVLEEGVEEAAERKARRDMAAHVAVTTRAELFERAEALAWRLSSDLGIAVRLSVTDNRSTMVSFRRGASLLHLRLHHMFLEAPEEVVRAVADYAGRGRKGAGGVLDAFIRRQQPRIRLERHADEPELNPRGQCFDLQRIFESVNATYFQGTIQARIGWGRMAPRRRRKTIRLGVYDHQTREIRIHPALDKPQVPAFFVEFIVFHEMLHQLFPSNGHGGRRVHHPRAFRERERAYPLYEAALRWERENLALLLRG